MSRWIRTRQVAPNLYQLPDTGSGQPSAVVNPYAVPDAFRVVSSKGRMRVEFRYIDGDEAPSEKPIASDGVRFEVGKYTSRILAIDFAEVEWPAHHQSEAIDRAVSEVLEALVVLVEKTSKVNMESTRITLSRGRQELAKEYA